MPYNSETEKFYQAPATVVDSTPDGDTVQEGFDDRLTPAMAGLYADLNLLKANGMISVGIPATTTSRGIGRVATLADMTPGAEVNNGPAFLSAKGGVITTTPTAHAVPQADADGTLNNWFGQANETNLGLVQLATVAQAQALTNDANALTPKKLADAFGGGNQGLAASGYQKLPGGLIIQWGVSTPSGGSQSISLPISFPNEFFAVVSQISAPTTDTYAFVNAIKKSNSGFTLTTRNAQGAAGAYQTNWIAIGY